MNKMEIACTDFFTKTPEEKEEIINKMVSSLDDFVTKYSPPLLGFMKTIELTQSFIERKIDEEKYEIAHVATQAFTLFRQKHANTNITELCQH
jgi:hypothetical protein